jgi:hypothetical protein
VSKKGRVIELQNRQVDAGSDRDDGRRHLVAGRIGLDLHLACVQNHVSIGQNALAFDHHAGSRDVGGRLLGPWFEGIGIAHGRKDLDHGILDRLDRVTGLPSGGE